MKVDLTETEIKLLARMLDMIQVNLAEAPDMLVLRGKIKDAIQDKP
ncbi:unnamed protein product [marine sediment metagenome]|uniref:Uncharacterized protein n=1 Tax=marine sediment metagenome TaxID=412755 RepID=X1GL96_9ZZZZ